MQEASNSPGTARSLARAAVEIGQPESTQGKLEGTLDADILVDVLPNLSAAADQLTEFLLPQPTERTRTWREIHHVGSRLSRLCKSRIAQFKVPKESVAGSLYIRPDEVLYALFGSSQPPNPVTAPWRPDDIIYRINLAEMLRTLLVDVSTPAAVSTDTVKAFEKLVENYGTAIAGSSFAAGVFVELQTQLLLMRLQTLESTGNPHDPLREIFLTTVDGATTYKLPGGVLSEETDKLMNGRIQLLSTVLDGWKTNSAGTLETLQSKFPWDLFLDHAIAFCTERKANLDERINEAGGPEAILTRLANIKRVPSSNADSFKNQIAQLKAREKRLASSSAPVMDPRLMQDISEADPTVQVSPAKSSDQLEFQTPPTQRGRQWSTSHQRDPTPLPFDIPSPPSFPSQPYVGRDSSFDPTQDEGFQTDSRDLTAADERRRAVGLYSRTGPYPIAGTHSTVGVRSSTTVHPTTEFASPRVHSRKRPWSPSAPISTTYEEAKIRRKERHIVPTDRGQQVRTPWTNDEEDALVSLISRKPDQKLSYSVLKQYDNNHEQCLRIRSPEDIRCKARNVKMTYLLGKVELPPGWDRVILDKKAIRRLHDQGIDYEQPRVRRAFNPRSRNSASPSPPTPSTPDLSQVLNQTQPLTHQQGAVEQANMVSQLHSSIRDMEA
ncbi:hypothetical protein K470DRAFT_273518 [Piedraia hortae CBS 480.64]|uniref:Myb-like domain-containing protein n=1 Tax=Piedraia hortae CBS 480.64 TaxID=1314780 RepID=A0A6A7BR59_9PEZI|nr:hypothetical protein K470DRAFT_273518 [Piedraia hortae CBS 480.64]